MNEDQKKALLEFARAVRELAEEIPFSHLPGYVIRQVKDAVEEIEKEFGL